MKLWMLLAWWWALLAVACSAGDGDVQLLHERVDGDAVAGRTTYDVYCAFCHGAEGEGYLQDNANALSNQDFLRSASNAFLRAGIVHGRPGTPMSPWGAAAGGPLGAAQVEDVLALIRGWQREPSVALPAPTPGGVAVRGGGPWAALCAGCHGDAGEGRTALSLNNPWFLETADDAFVEFAIRQGRRGTSMPGFDGRLSDVAIADLVALIRSWAVPVDGSAPPAYEPDWDRAVLNPSGPDAGFELREGRYVAADDVLAAMQGGQRLMVIDARPLSDFALGHIEGAVGLPFFALEASLDRIPRDVFVVAYCGCPHAVSGQAVDRLRAAGHERSAVLDEGWYVWRDRGYPSVLP